MAGLNIAVDAKVTPTLPQLSFVVDSDGCLIGFEHSNGKRTWLPASDWDDNITASVSSDQAGGVPIRYKNSRITTVGTIGDSVTLPFGQEGMSLIIVNSGANSADIFPATGQIINAGAADAALALAAAARVRLEYTGGRWFSNLSA